MWVALRQSVRASVRLSAARARPVPWGSRLVHTANAARSYGGASGGGGGGTGEGQGSQLGRVARRGAVKAKLKPCIPCVSICSSPRSARRRSAWRGVAWRGLARTSSAWLLPPYRASVRGGWPFQGIVVVFLLLLLVFFDWSEPRHFLSRATDLQPMRSGPGH